MGPPLLAAGLMDTNVFVDVLRRYQPAEVFLKAYMTIHPADTSIVSAMELVRGCRDGKELTDLQTFLAGFNVSPITPSISTLAFDLLVRFRLSHNLGISDSLIAATALDQGLPVYTHNRKHFQMIPTLTILTPY